MKTYCRLLLIAAVLSLLAACRDEPPKPWIPVLEKVDFVALHDAVGKAQEQVDQARSQLESGANEAAARDLEAARQSLFRIERYFLPMTEVRQLIFDADRVYYLGRVEDAQGKLREATALLNRIGEDGGQNVAEAVTAVVEKIDMLQRNIAAGSPQVADEMRELGEKVNLMILKGDLVLAGATFSAGE